MRNTQNKAGGKLALLRDKPAARLALTQAGASPQNRCCHTTEAARPPALSTLAPSCSRRWPFIGTA